MKPDKINFRNDMTEKLLDKSSHVPSNPKFNDINLLPETDRSGQYKTIQPDDIMNSNENNFMGDFGSSKKRNGTEISQKYGDTSEYMLTESQRGPRESRTSLPSTSEGEYNENVRDLHPYQQKGTEKGSQQSFGHRKLKSMSSLKSEVSVIPRTKVSNTSIN